MDTLLILIWAAAFAYMAFKAARDIRLGQPARTHVVMAVLFGLFFVEKLLSHNGIIGTAVSAVFFLAAVGVAVFVLPQHGKEGSK